MNLTRKEQRALDALQNLIEQGVEYPDAEWRASNEGKLIDCSRLRELYDAASVQRPSIDDCVRAVTACASFDELKATEPSYAPSFYPSRAYSKAEVAMMERVCAAFNAWAEREGRERRAKVYRIQAAGEQRKGPFA